MTTSPFIRRSVALAATLVFGVAGLSACVESEAGDGPEPGEAPAQPAVVEPAHDAAAAEEPAAQGDTCQTQDSNYYQDFMAERLRAGEEYREHREKEKQLEQQRYLDPRLARRAE